MPLTALREILEAAAFRPSGTPDIHGADPAARTRYRVGTAGAAALGALGLAAAHVWQLRGGRAQRVAVDVRAAAASLGFALSTGVISSITLRLSPWRSQQSASSSTTWRLPGCVSCSAESCPAASEIRPDL